MTLNMRKVRHEDVWGVGDWDMDGAPSEYARWLEGFRLAEREQEKRCHLIVTRELPGSIAKSAAVTLEHGKFRVVVVSYPPDRQQDIEDANDLADRILMDGGVLASVSDYDDARQRFPIAYVGGYSLLAYSPEAAADYRRVLRDRLGESDEQ